MAIAHDTHSLTTPDTGNLSWTHTPVGTPRGIIVLIVQNVGITDEITSVTYGGVNLTQATGSPLLGDAGSEDGSVMIWHLLSGVPSGPQTVVVNVDGTGSTKAAVCVSVTANTNIVVENSGAAQGLNSNLNIAPTCGSFGIATENEVYWIGAIHSGRDAVTQLAAASGYTDIAEYDFGSQTGSWIRKTANTAGSGTYSNMLAWDFTLSDEAHCLGIALTEEEPTDVFIGGLHEIEDGIVSSTAVQLGGVLQS